MKPAAKILVIGNYPPPMCGWAMQTKLVVDELRRRAHVCEVLNAPAVPYSTPAKAACTAFTSAPRSLSSKPAFANLLDGER